MLNSYEESMYEEINDEPLLKFIDGEMGNKVFVNIVDGKARFYFQKFPDVDPNGQVQYFLKPLNTPTITSSNVDQIIQYGIINGPAMDSLLQKMNGVFKNILTVKDDWPESIKKDITESLHKFMASITETVYHSKGQTILYVPNDKITSIEEAARDKELLQRYDTTVIHWTRQLKDLLNNQNNSNTDNENSGPLEEINFWQSRTDDLAGIQEQLQKPGVALVIQVLTESKSSYLNPFLQQIKTIDAGLEESRDNIKFLDKMKVPCEQLSKSSPSEIPKVLPIILNNIRFIWANSHYYNTSERITNICRKVSNEIIARCRDNIVLDDIFGKNVKKSMPRLEECIKCGAEWKRCFNDLQDAINLVQLPTDTHLWQVDMTSIFAQVEAFVQRCKDLIEICESQLQFTRSPDTMEPTPNGLPIFGGSKGPEICKSIMELEHSFKKHLDRLKVIKEDVLDVRSTQWHENFNQFKNGIKDLEVMMQNVMTAAFANVKTIEAGVETLHAFHRIIRRQSLIRYLNSKRSLMYQMFQTKLREARNEFDSNRFHPNLDPDEPEFSGAAIWAHGIQQRIEHEYQLLCTCAFETPALEAPSVEEETKIFYNILEEYMLRKHQEWLSSIGDSQSIQAKLEKPLMARIRTGPLAPDHLLCNFDPDVLGLFTEGFYWQKLGPKYQLQMGATDILTQESRLRLLRDNVMWVVRDYNLILDSLSSDEKKLFQEHIRKLDSRAQMGLTKLTWVSKNMVEWYIAECRKHCSSLYQTVCDFKVKHAKIKRLIRSVKESLLLEFERNRIYTVDEFTTAQETHREKMTNFLNKQHLEIRNTLKEIYKFFIEDPFIIQREWLNFLRLLDKQVEEALRYSLRKSLTELSRIINGDKKNEPRAAFKVDVILDGQEVGFIPPTEKFQESINLVMRNMAKVIECVPHLSVTLHEEVLEFKEALLKTGDESIKPIVEVIEPKSFYDIIAQEPETNQLGGLITNGFGNVLVLLQKHVSHWDSYKSLWEKDKKEAYIKRLAKANRPLSQYVADIQRYIKIQHEIEAQEPSTTVSFIKLDCSILKNTLIEMCIDWQNRHTGLLNDNASKDLEAIYTLMKTNTEKMQQKPTNLDELSVAIKRLAELREKSPEIEASFPGIEERYNTLSQFDVDLPEAESNLLTNLRPEWAKFQQVMVETDEMLQKSKQAMKHDLEDSIKSYANQVKDLRDDFVNNIPSGADKSIEEAFEIINHYKQKIAQLKEKEKKLLPGLEIFNIPQEEYKDMVDTEKDLEILEKIWTMNKEWAEHWDSWKFGLFRDLDAPKMENFAQTTFKDLTKLGRTIKNWGVWQDLKARVDQFRVTIPLIMDLRNPAMRPRHWDQLRNAIGKEFDPEGDDFTLETIYSLGLHNHAEFIGELSSNANQELAIENSLKNIEEGWSKEPLVIAPFKEKYFKITTTEDLYNRLDENQVNLSTMNASRFFKSFETQIMYWTSALRTVSEVVDISLMVQRQWMYLENIFMASEDIQKQLPQETTLFMKVNNEYVAMMAEMYETKIAFKCCTKEGVLQKLRQMSADLDSIQKSLDQYLETKRQKFPRFYFLSNDDLLEILGQQKDPMQVQKHIKKCFVGINLLDFIAPGVQNNRDIEARAMKAADGEVLPFVENVRIGGPVEDWLIQVEKMMVRTVKKELYTTITTNSASKKEKWIKENPGQLLITVGKIQWTQNCMKAFREIGKGSKTAMKKEKKKQHIYLSRLADMVRGKLTKVERYKLVALITMEIHSRDVIERLIKADCQSEYDFDWQSQLRFFYEKETQGTDNGAQCKVLQCNADIQFGNEYQGNNGRLVITPLTDRCILTLTTALHLQRGGNPLGPAGTGKTETVKDLGKNLAKFVVVFNCSDGLDYKSVGRMFSGLVQSGGWGCFDEFNRIEVEVLSVVAQQILSIMNAISAGLETFVFEGHNVKCNPNCGIFVTMNPGYAGRSELPDNLKSLMRPVAMMVPDLAMISEVMLMAEGFRDARNLAKKTVTLYHLMVQQLSKQDHYDYGLRSLKAVLNCAGALKRNQPDMPEDVIVLRALRDMNVPKFIKEDFRLFILLLADLFPGLELPQSEVGSLQIAIEEELEKAKLQKNENIIHKTIQLYESKATRHCNMLVGKSLSGKSTAWKMLAAAKTNLREKKDPNHFAVAYDILNPKSVPLNDLYGYYELATMEWHDGILSTLFRSEANETDVKDASDLETVKEHWLILDGPVDTLWIESMNTVMDDNKTLTLINGDRIAMTEYMSLLFEVLDLAVASPATVSRAGMVYLDLEDLGWRPYVKTWIAAHYGNDPEIAENLQGMFDKYVDPILAYKHKKVEELVPISDFNAVRSLCNLYETLATPENGLDKSVDPEGYYVLADKWFSFCVVWSLCAAANEKGRVYLDEYIKDMETQFPPHSSIYDYWVDVKSKEFKVWDDKVNKTWRPAPNAPFFKIIVPTVDTLRNTFIFKNLILNNHAVLIVGNTGTGKTVLIQSLLEQLPQTHTKLTVNFSAASTATGTQAIIEGSMEKRAKGKLGPPGGKQMICFIDDLNMPKKDLFGSQPALEILRQYIDYGGWYDLHKLTWTKILDLQLLAAMGPPGGGRSEISPRIQTRFNLINFTFPADVQIHKIYGAILTPKLEEFDQDIRSIAPLIVEATVSLYQQVSKYFLPTPTKAHYSFNMRDIAKVIQGLLEAQKKFIDSSDALLRLWIHECQRVFSDRLINQEDRDKCKDFIDKELKDVLRSGWEAAMTGSPFPPMGPLYVYGDFLDIAADNNPYVEVLDVAKLRGFLESSLETYNLEPGVIPMDLVLFLDAICHITRICRVLHQPRGNLMLVGVGGSGRQSLSRLSAYACEMKTFSIEISKNYRLQEFHDDLKELYKQVGLEDKPTTFLFCDTQIKEEAFLEDINNILSSGEVPNLYQVDELGRLYDDLRPIAKKLGLEQTADSLWQYFINKVRENMHVILCMSPIGSNFRNRCRMYPSLVNCTTIDWFFEWPVDALEEVAKKFLEPVHFTSTVPEISLKVARTFAHVHKAVVESSAQMAIEMKRFNYVTPTNYLELVKGYRELLNEKQNEIIEGRAKLQGGLQKLEDSRLQVEVMSKELEEKKIVVAESQKKCEDLLVVIVGEKRAADEQKKQVEADSERIAVEEKECKRIAADAEADLAAAMPALNAAMEEVKKLDKNSITEVKSYTKPPELVESVLSAVMILFNQKPDWSTAKREMSAPDFLKKVLEYPKENVTPSMINRVKKYTQKENFTKEAVLKVSVAAAALCVWVHAIVLFSTIYREVLPKKEALEAAQASLKAKQDALKEAQEQLKAVIEKVAMLNAQYNASVDEKNKLKAEAEALEARLARAQTLVENLSGERERWEASIAAYNESEITTVGDCLLAAGCLSYSGPFDSLYRTNLIRRWLIHIRKNEIPSTPSFGFSNYLADPTDVREWNIQGLPNDNFSTENGVIVTRGRRWPLMIDPQVQANKWIKNLEGNKLKIVDPKKKDFLRTLESAVQYGMPYLMQDVGEELDPSLESVLNKAVKKVGNREIIKVGDKDVDYNKDFRFYLTTKLSNPHYTPEVSTKTIIVNFAVKEVGLEQQLLGLVVQAEEPALENQKSELVVAVANGKKKLKELEETILRLLSNVKGSLLDDEDVVQTLQLSKNTSEQVQEQLAISQETEKKIDQARSGYTPVSTRASILFFVLNDMSRVDPMYQFSLDSYFQLFQQSINNSRSKYNARMKLDERIKGINEYHTYAVYKFACRGLFEKHKLLFSMQMCVKIMEHDKKIPMDEFDFFLRGGFVMDKTEQPSCPCKEWMDEQTWDNLTELNKLQEFQGILGSFEQNNKEWKQWYMSHTPETNPLPGELSNSLTQLQQLVLLRCIRIDRVSFSATKFVADNLDPKYVEPPPFNLKEIFETSSPTLPLIFVLSPGVDPTKQVQALADELGFKLDTCALGQGQAPIATNLINNALKDGSWVFLANCHLMTSWMGDLEKLIESYTANPDIHPNFRLWLSSNPSKDFPITILQNGVKMTTEPPKGLRANLLRLYSQITEEQINKCVDVVKYKKLIFALSWFHSVLLERRKFKTLGFNIPYDFNDSDFSICQDIICDYLNKFTEKTPWDALRYLIAEANYGGRVTDDWDRKLVNVYIQQYLCDDVLEVAKYPLSSLPIYYIPLDGDRQSYIEYIISLPQNDDPAAFGQHPNADIASMIEDTKDLLDTLISLQPARVSTEGEKSEDKVLAIAKDLETKIPNMFQFEEVKETVMNSENPDPIKTVLLQEIERYNKLLFVLKTMVEDLQKGIKGFVVITPELENVFNALLNGKVPDEWSFCYPSLKPLGTWIRDLNMRIDQFVSWVENFMPKVIWLSGFTYPSGFLTAMLQITARKNNVSIDTLGWTFPIITADEKTIAGPAKDGAYIKGIFLEGAKWDYENACLTDANPMELYSAMPIIHFKPAEIKKKTAKDVYICPLYLYPVRTGTRERPSFTTIVEVKCGKEGPKFWTKRGTAMLLSLPS